MVMETLGSFSGRRLALSPAGPWPSAVWSDRRNRSLYAAWLPTDGTPVEPVRIRLGSGRQTLQPTIQTLSRRAVAIAWADGRGPRSRVQVVTGRLDPKDGFTVLSRFSTASGQGEPDLSLTPMVSLCWPGAGA